MLWPSPTGTVTLEDDVNKKPFDPLKPPKGFYLVPTESVYVAENPATDGGGIVAMGVQHEIDHLNGLILERNPKAVEVPSLEAPKWKVGRNDPCPCGSMKKFKKCCLSKMT
jgi:hypothetical protein